MSIDRRTLLKTAGSVALLGPAGAAAAPAENIRLDELPQRLKLLLVPVRIARQQNADTRYRNLPFYAQTRFWDYVPYRVTEA
jgi:hypothetical protein